MQELSDKLSVAREEQSIVAENLANANSERVELKRDLDEKCAQFTRLQAAAAIYDGDVRCVHLRPIFLTDTLIKLSSVRGELESVKHALETLQKLHKDAIKTLEQARTEARKVLEDKEAELVKLRQQFWNDDDHNNAALKRSLDEQSRLNSEVRCRLY